MGAREGEHGADATLDAALLAGWIGRERLARERLDAGRCRAFEATLDAAPVLAEGDPLPPLWHWLFFGDLTPTGVLDEDGHARRGGFLPPVALSRRMWAGGRVELVEPLPIGAELERRSRVADIRRTRGRSGELCFVTVEHRLLSGERTLLREEHDIVYREAAAPATAGATGSDGEGAARHMPCATAVPIEPLAAERWRVTPSIALLFRYSALSFNAHRIHFDRDYCRDVEGYPGLVVHGPLIATLLARLAERVGDRPLARFAYRAEAPLFDTAPFTIAVDGVEAGSLALVATRVDGVVAMRASATPVDG